MNLKPFLMDTDILYMYQNVQQPIPISNISSPAFDMESYEKIKSEGMRILAQNHHSQEIDDFLKQHLTEEK